MGEQLAQVAIDMITDYGIAAKLGYFMIDNTSNNDTMMVELSICKQINTPSYLPSSPIYIENSAP